MIKRITTKNFNQVDDVKLLPSHSFTVDQPNIKSRANPFTLILKQLWLTEGITMLIIHYNMINNEMIPIIKLGVQATQHYTYTLALLTNWCDYKANHQTTWVPNLQVIQYCASERSLVWTAHNATQQINKWFCYNQTTNWNTICSYITIETLLVIIITTLTKTK